jgi:acyl-CoA synthetase (AMP-forming)/AMP-acid ligase II
MSAAPLLPETVQSLPEALAFWAEQTPEAAAMILPGAPIITYAELWRRVQARAASLAAAGVRRNDRIVLVMADGVACTEALLGILLVGLAVPLPASATAPELDRALDGLRASAALVALGTPSMLREIFAAHGAAVMDIEQTDGLEPSSMDIPWPRGEELALVRQTSGTTGQPKRIPSPHGHMVAHGRRTRDMLGLGPGDRCPAVSSLATTLGTAVLAHAIVSGAALIVPPRSGFAETWDAIAREKPTWLSTSAGYLEVLARLLADEPDRLALRSVRYVQVTSAPIPEAVCLALERTLGAPILPRYSATETGAIAMTFPPPARRKPGSAGQPVQEVRLVGLDGEDVAPGTEGEIRVRGPRVMTGYLDDPEASAAALLPGGWYRTGDLGYLDEDGFLFLTGRLNELINRGGEKIAPAEVDGVLQSQPAIAEAATFAVSDARLGEDIVAAVVLREGMTIRAWELRAWLLERLSPAKVPRRFWFVEGLPRTSTGKVQRGVLAERFTRQRGGLRGGGVWAEG